MSACDAGSAWHTTVLPWLAPIVTISGWAIVNWQNNRRENRKEARALLDASKDLAVDIAANARAYMCQAARDEEAEAEIKAGLEELEIELLRLPMYERLRNLVSAVADFADAATGADFESANRRARDRSDPETQALMAARNVLLTRMEQVYASEYLPKSARRQNSWW